MSGVAEIYNAFWEDYEAANLGPYEFSYGPLKSKTNNAGYRQFPNKFSLGFYPVATLRLNGRNGGAIGVELISSSKQGWDFLSNAYQDLPAVSLGNTLAKVHFMKSEWKIELLWNDAKFEVSAHRAAHILWINLAIHTLALAYAAPLKKYEEGI